jgi:hypothetical protein
MLTGKPGSPMRPAVRITGEADPVRNRRSMRGKGSLNLGLNLRLRQLGLRLKATSGKAIFTGPARRLPGWLVRHQFSVLHREQRRK